MYVEDGDKLLTRNKICDVYLYTQVLQLLQQTVILER